MRGRRSMRVPALLVVLLLRAAIEAGEPAHVTAIDEFVLVPEDGLVLGNGDLSASIYQGADAVLWRLGKGDVWDRRIDRSDDPPAARIDEVARGIREEGWKCPPYGGPVEATKGTKNPARMREICQAVPPSYRARPYPCPKPVGEVALRIPADLPGLRIRQRLAIEEARAEVECSWPSGVRVRVESFIPPRTNVLVLRWRIEGWNDATRAGNNVPPLWLSLYRWADPPIAAYAARLWGDWRHDAFMACVSPKTTPLPPPTVRTEDGRPLIVQAFPADPTFPGGFECLAAPLAPGARIEAVGSSPGGEARLHILPSADACEGLVVIAVATTGDGGDAARSLREIVQAGGDLPAAVRSWDEETRSAAREFWSRSRVAIADPRLEQLWYETFHIRRATNRPGKYPPGLMLPSTVGDYSHWHGDYHTNYNLQEPFWGDLCANHVDLSDAYLDAIGPLVEVGRKIARDYYACRGTFIQLSGYPMRMDDDPLGCVPMGRMAYMTGWAVNQLWWRYLHTLDREWLREKGWPIIRDCALFYTDFMTKGGDGLWHVFPSNQGEDGFSGDPKDFTDRPQVMAHLRYCLRAAIEASEALGVEPELRQAWRDRLENCAGDDGQPPQKLEGIAGECARRCPPELGPGRPYVARRAEGDGPGWPPEGDGAWTWYFGQYSWMAIRRLRAGDWSPERDFAAFRRMVERWRRPGGILGGMAVANYGRAGAWTESLGVAAALQEMMLQSWDGALRIFPGWPGGVDCTFQDFRGEGAFLVSAEWKSGAVARLEVRSEKGGRCRLYSPWPEGVAVIDNGGRRVPVENDQWGRAGFDAAPGGVYRIAQASR